MTERRELFGRDDIKALAQAYDILVDELSIVYFNQNEDKIGEAQLAVDTLLADWGLWDNDHGWVK